ncbi:MAG: ATPase [Pseudomonas formosensis]|jgi:chromosome segregation ATPase|nr:ATPase [Halopseudomonas formosensis]
MVLMRDDFDGKLPDIRATDDDRVAAPGTGRPTEAVEPPLVRAVREPAPRRSGNGLLWAVCISLLLAFVGLGYWSHEQQSRLQRQLVATQESFARISEDAAGRLQDISGKVIATESTLSQTEQERLRQINQLEQRMEQLATRQQEQQQTLQQHGQGLEGLRSRLAPLQQSGESQARQLADLAEQLGQLEQQLAQQQQALNDASGQLESAARDQQKLRAELTALSEPVQGLARFEQQLAEAQTQLARQQGELQALRQAASAPGMEQELLVLRSELDNRLMAMEEALQSIDSFRLQTNRTISTVRDQLAGLQQQINQR